MKRRFRYFAVMLGDCIEIRRGFAPPKKITSKLQLPKTNGTRHPETMEFLGTVLIQTYYDGCRVMAICKYSKFYLVAGMLKTDGCRELTRTEKDLVMKVATVI